MEMHGLYCLSRPSEYLILVTGIARLLTRFTQCVSLQQLQSINLLLHKFQLRFFHLLLILRRSHHYRRPIVNLSTSLSKLPLLVTRAFLLL